MPAPWPKLISPKPFRPPPSGCHRCFALDRRVRDCRDPVKCGRCGVVGHMERFCRSPRRLPRRDTSWPAHPTARRASPSPRLTPNPSPTQPLSPPSSATTTPSAFHPYYVLSSSGSNLATAIGYPPVLPTSAVASAVTAGRLNFTLTPSRFLEVHCTGSPAHPAMATASEPPSGDRAHPPSASPPRHAAP